MKMGRSKLKCEGELTVVSPWSHAVGEEDPEMDYLVQFASWIGYEAWLDSVKNRTSKDPRKEKANLEDDELLYYAQWLLEFLPDTVLKSIIPQDQQVEKVISDNELKQIEESLLLMLEDDQLYEYPPFEFHSMSSKTSKMLTKRLSVDLKVASATSRRSKSASRQEKGSKIEVDATKTSLDNGNGKKKKGKKDPTATKGKKVKEEPIIVEDLGPQSQMPQLLELFAEFDCIQKMKKEFEKSVQPLMYPENTKLALSPPKVFISGFLQYRNHRAIYSLINTSTRWIVVTFDKIDSPFSFYFKITGPNVVRMAPGGFQYYKLEFCSDQCEDVHANISYLIRSSDQSLTQRILQVICLTSCVNPPPESSAVAEEQSTYFLCE